MEVNLAMRKAFLHFLAVFTPKFTAFIAIRRAFIAMGRVFIAIRSAFLAMRRAYTSNATVLLQSR
jgi:hypothetical protein